MPDAPLSIFISYSRTDSAFVDRLEADLKARSFQPWVDRRKLEGGQDWLDQIQEAIDQCQVVLVALSSEAVQSKYVRMEYRYALSQNKVVIPLEYQPPGTVPIDLHTIERIMFHSSYDQGLQNLLQALSHFSGAATSPPEAITRHAIAQLSRLLQEKGMATPPPAVDTPQQEKQSDKQTPESIGENLRYAASFQDILEQFGLSTHQEHPGHKSGQSVRSELTISFEEAVFGCQKEVEILRWENCTACKGSGIQRGTQAQPCSTCQGQRRIRINC